MRAFLAAAALCCAPAALMSQDIVRYVRYTAGGAPSYGRLEGNTIHELRGELLANPRPTGRTVPVSAARLLAPIVPGKVIAVGLNYQSHLGERPAAEYPGLFAKYPSSIIGPDEAIVLPHDATNTHYEGEMVVVIGRRASNVTPAQARSHIFGVTAGNDVSERNWQRADLQWFRAKASDGFGPIGPVITTGLNYDDLRLETRVNGQVVQSQRTKDLIFSVADVVSYVSRYVTLEPGDVVEVELEGVGVLRNTVTRTTAAAQPPITASGRLAELAAIASGGFPMHTMERPQPPVVTPPPATGPVPPPADAIVLFDGVSLRHWRSIDSTASPARWRVETGYMEVAPGTGSIMTTREFGDVQLHVEWATGSPPRGEGQNRSNSGVFLMGRYEVQVLDSYRNPTYPDGMAGAIYGQFPPLVNASRPPGEWQTYDIVFRAPRFEGTRVVSPARATVFLNGILVQDNVTLLGPTTHRHRAPYEAHPPHGPIMLQDHGELVRFRNIWVRELP
jgi:2-keto-4-pentenoate hydratase/2-oxohepta-3-ene-1,7-dioic acid hydratase in catechol pathway